MLKDMVEEYALLLTQVGALHEVMQAAGRVCPHLRLVHQCRLKCELDMEELGKLKEQNWVQSQMLIESKHQVDKMSQELIETQRQVKFLESLACTVDV